MSSTNENRESIPATFGFNDNYEREQFEYFQAVLQGKTRFLDVGANRGIYAYTANMIMRNGYVALVEANPGLAEKLRKDVSGWPRDNGNTIEVFGIAASNREETLPFYEGNLDTLGTLVAKNNVAGSGTPVFVRCAPLDTVFKPMEHTLIKIDVEGFEYRVLLGARKLLAQSRVFVEMHGWGDRLFNKYPIHVLFLMNSLGFEVKRIGDSYAYDFVKAGALRRLLGLMRYAPIMSAKYIIRALGLRDLIYTLIGFLLGKKAGRYPVKKG